MPTGKYIGLNRWKSADNNISIFASGEKEGGGSGARKVIEQILKGQTDISNILLVSNHENGGVSDIISEYKYKLQDLGIGLYFHHIDRFPKRNKETKEYSPEIISEIKKIYQDIFQENNLKYVFLSGWMKLILGLPPETCINIHPGPTQKPYGGKGMHGINIHEKIWKDYQQGKIKKTCITIHYVTEEFDQGPIIAQIPVDISSCKSPQDIEKTVNKIEHIYQPIITEMIINGVISWSGKKGDKIQFPDNFKWDTFVNLAK